MAKFLIGLIATLLCLVANAEPKVTYVGLGRYSCSGTTRECEPVLRRNDALELQRLQTRELEFQRRELEKQTDLLKSEQRRNEMARGRNF
jgi:hypothetical protein